MSKNPTKSAKLRLQFDLMPHTTPERFKALFVVAKQRWVGKALAYVGSNPTGHHMQEWGNPKPFLITDAELDAALAAQ